MPDTRGRVAAQPRMATLFTAVFAVFGFAAGIVRLGDNSFFWHLRTGEWILDHGIPHHDPYSFTHHGIRWVAQSWLAELVYGVLYRSALGAYGVRLFAGVVSMALSVLAFRLALRLTRERVRAALVTVVSLAGLYSIWSTRPLLLGALAFTALVWIIEVPDSWCGRRAPIAIPVLLWVWANVHGTFVLGFVYLGIHLVGRWTEGARPWKGRERGVLTGVGIAAVAVFANPYGIDLVRFPVDLVRRGDVLARVNEWKSPSLRSIQGRVFAAWLAVLLACVARGRVRVGRRDVMILVPFVLLALWAQRNIALAPLVALPIIARSVQPETAPPDAPARWGRLVLAGLILVGIGYAYRAAGERDFTLEQQPVAAMRSLEDRGLLGRRLLADDGWGGYIILEHWPRQHVFIDDRFDMYPVSFAADYFTLSDGGPGWDRILARYRVETVVWAPEDPLAQLLAQSHDWVRIHRDRHAVVFVRRDVLRAAG